MGHKRNIFLLFILEKKRVYINYVHVDAHSGGDILLKKYDERKILAKLLKSKLQCRIFFFYLVLHYLNENFKIPYAKIPKTFQNLTQKFTSIDILQKENDERIENFEIPEQHFTRKNNRSK